MEAVADVLEMLGNVAASIGNVKVIQWALVDHSHALQREDCVAAGSNGHVNILE